MNKSVLRGYAYEYLIAQSLIDNSIYSPYISREDSQWDLIETRRKYSRILEDKYYDEYIELKNQSLQATALLPAAYGEISFTPQAANGSEVYDVMYESSDDFIKISCKTTEVEDKTYLFNTTDYDFKYVNKLNDTIFTNVNNTYNENLNDKNLLLKDYIDNVIVNIINEKESIENLYKLTREKFIGNGGYYKTLGNGGIRYYPTLTNEDDIVIDRLSSIDNVITYNVKSFDKNNDLKQEYNITMRIKFKNILDNKIKFSKNGLLNGLYASVVLQLVNPLEKF